MNLDGTTFAPPPRAAPDRDRVRNPDRGPNRDVRNRNRDRDDDRGRPPPPRNAGIAPGFDPRLGGGRPIYGNQDRNRAFAPNKPPRDARGRDRDDRGDKRPPPRARPDRGPPQGREAGATAPRRPPPPNGFIPNQTQRGDGGKPKKRKNKDED